MNLNIFAFHVGSIMTQKANSVTTYSPLEGLDIQVKINEVKLSKGSWEDCYLKRNQDDWTWAGNRWGAIETFADMVKMHLADTAPLT